MDLKRLLQEEQRNAHTAWTSVPPINAMNSLRFSHEARGPYLCALLKKSLQPDPISLPECFWVWDGENEFFLKEKTQRNEERKATKRRDAGEEGRWNPEKHEPLWKGRVRWKPRTLIITWTPFHPHCIAILLSDIRWFRTLKHLRLGLNKFIMTQWLLNTSAWRKHSKPDWQCLCWQCSFHIWEAMTFSPMT